MDVPPAFRRPLVAAPVPWASTPPSPRAGAAAAERPIRSSFPPARMPTEPAQAPDPWDMPASSQVGMADDQSAHDRDSSVRPSAGSRRRSVTTYRNRLSDVEIAGIERDMTDEYPQHKRAMHKAGARASSADNPGAVRHLRKQFVADVVDLENRARSGEESARPKPAATDSSAAGSAGGRLGARPARRRPRRHRHAWGRPVVVGNGRDHFGHECAQCHGHGTAFG